jgi:hypothetical protein
MLRLYATLLAAALGLGLAACASSEGGKQSGGGSGGSDRSDDAKRLSSGGAEDEDGEDEDGTGSKGGGKTGGSDGGKTTGDDGGTSDGDVCAFLKGRGAVSTRVADQVGYLCDKGGLKSLSGNANGQVKVTEDRQDGDISHFTMAGAVKAGGSVAAAQKLGEIYCSDFGKYKSLLGAATFKDVQSITPQNAQGDACDYQFVGKTQVIFTPKFTGRQRVFVNKAGNVALWANYLIKQDSLVQDSVTLNVLIDQGGGKVLCLSVMTNAADTKGFHDAARDALVAGNNTGLQAFGAAMGKVGN